MRSGLAFPVPDLDCDPTSTGGGNGGAPDHGRMIAIALAPLVLLAVLLGWLAVRWLATCGCWQTALGWSAGSVAGLMLIILLAFLWWCLFGDDYRPAPHAPHPPRATPTDLPALLPRPAERPALPAPARPMLPAPEGEPLAGYYWTIREGVTDGRHQ